MSRLTHPLLLQLLLAVVMLSGTVQARQLRINRYSTRIEEAESANGEAAVVREVHPTPYPAAGFRPGRAFNLPGEEQDVEEGSGLGTTTTEISADLYTTTTEAFDAETTTLYNDVPAELLNDNAAKQGRAAKVPYPPSGWRPNRAFLLPTEVQAAKEAEAAAVAQNDSEVVDAVPTSTATPLAPFTTELPNAADDADDAAGATAPQSRVRQPKAPYPPSGFRPSRAFLLPTELKASVNQKSAISVTDPESPVSAADKAGHPPCGVSDNPVAPKPVEGAEENPDAERVYVTANLGPAAANSPLTLPVILRSERLISTPIYVPPGRPFAYSATFQSWR